VTQTTVQVGRTSTGTPAREPDASGFVERDGVRVQWESYGSGDPAILLLPAWSIVHSRMWKAQIAYLARHFKVVTFDARGNGLSDRPLDPAKYTDAELVQDALDVLDAAGVDAAVLAGVSSGPRYAIELAVMHPERVLGVFAIAPSIGYLSPPHPWRRGGDESFAVERDTYTGWEKENKHYWLANWPEYVEFFWSEILTEPHSTKQFEDAIAWGLDTTPETMLCTESELLYEPTHEDVVAFCERVRCPVLVLHGSDDRITPFHRGVKLAEVTGGAFVALEGSGHAPQGRDPVRVNLLLREFAEGLAGEAPPAPPAQWRRVASRPRRALFVSSPIGLGHAWRDIAIADALRARLPDLEIQWLAQDPVTTVLRERGETIHPASAELAAESDHVDREAGEHDLHAFQMLRRMDEILCSNFMVFHDLVREENFDVWVGDEAWELDYFLHENPELKTAPFAWLTDFVGYLPMPDGGKHEAYLTADYNAEMIGHVERLPHVRDRAIYIGAAGDIVPDAFGPGLPAIRDWTERHYSMAGYIPGFDPSALPPREVLRAQLGFEPDERVCVVSVGGSGVGEPLLRRMLDALPIAGELVPGLRALVVTGPRIDPSSLPVLDGVEVRGYVHELYRYLAACDVAVVQQGLTTTMELVTAGRPFLSLPLAHHFEQRYHVRHRLDRHGACDWMEWDAASPEAIASAIARLVDTTPGYEPVPRDGAARAAGLIAELIGER
jgi:pimeloyl-ACP methyl ester carboxylesterase/predicted glycosyltransferase